MVYAARVDFAGARRSDEVETVILSRCAVTHTHTFHARTVGETSVWVSVLVSVSTRG